MTKPFFSTQKIPQGFTTSAMHIGFKRKNLDFAVVKSSALCDVAVMVTKNKFKGAPLLVSLDHIKNGKAQVIAVNSGNANAGNGAEGIKDAYEIAEIVARKVGVEVDDVIVASTGVIGKKMPMHYVREKIKELPSLNTNFVLSEQAILTTDTKAKSISVEVCGAVIKGFAKGSGMIYPHLVGQSRKHATMLAFILTDAKFSDRALNKMLKSAVDCSFNGISVDGDMSCNDMVVLMANGMSKVLVDQIHFGQALKYVCQSLAKMIAEDGEGATKMIEAKVAGARCFGIAKKLALSLVASPLIKTAVYGKSPNWGRIATRIGSENGSFSIDKMEIAMNGQCLFKEGICCEFDKNAVVKSFEAKIVSICVDLHEGDKSFTAYGCDLTPEYVAINAAYS
jgi:glutamate N-acetyltransferase/amino-acid N-acetyltransferase